jgi:hypothetical protein
VEDPAQENLVQAGERVPRQEADVEVMVDQRQYLQKQSEVMPLKEGHPTYQKNVLA